MLFNRYFFYIYIFFLHSLAFAYPPLSINEFDTINDISQKISTTCPKENCLIIGLGRSPTAIIANLQANYPQSEAINVPLSALKVTNLSAEQENILFAHFDVFITPHLKDKNKVVLLDYTLKGKGFFAGVFYINRFLEKLVKDSPITPIAFVFTARDRTSLVKKLFEKTKIDLVTYSLNPYHEFQVSLEREGYDPASEFGSFRIGEEKKKKISSEKYMALRELMKKMPVLRLASKEELLKEFYDDNNEISNAAVTLWSDKFDFSDRDEIKLLVDLSEQLIVSPKRAETAKFRATILGVLTSIIKKRHPKTYGLYDTFINSAVDNIKDADEMVRRSAKNALNIIDITDSHMWNVFKKILIGEDKAIRDAVIDALDDASTRYYVIKFLKTMELKANDFAAIKELVSQISSQNKDARRLAIDSLRGLELSRTDDEELFDNINDLIFTKISNTDDLVIISSLIDALAVMRPDDLAIQEFLVRNIESGDKDIRLSSVNALKNIRPQDPKTLGRLQFKLESTNAEIRSSVVDILNTVLWSEDNSDVLESIVFAVAHLLTNNDESKQTIIDALKFLERNIQIKSLEIDTLVYEYIAKRLLSDDPDVQQSAGAAFASIKIKDVAQKDYLPLLFPVLTSGNMTAVILAVKLLEVFKLLYDANRIKIDDNILEQINKLHSDDKWIQNKIEYLVNLLKKAQ